MTPGPILIMVISKERLPLALVTYNNITEYYKKVTEYQKFGIKVTVAIGGWNDSEGDKYSRLVNIPAARKKFIDHVLKFIEKHNFDGLDLDWEYPSCWQV